MNFCIFHIDSSCVTILGNSYNKFSLAAEYQPRASCRPVSLKRVPAHPCPIRVEYVLAEMCHKSVSSIFLQASLDYNFLLFKDQFSQPKVTPVSSEKNVQCWLGVCI